MKTHESIRIFKSPFMESLTHVHPLTPLFLWTPVIIYWLYEAVVEMKLAVTELFLCAFFGLFMWTFTEYILHRFVFHFPAKNRLTKRFVFLFHGLHHDDPDDPTRLVMPPLPAILITIFLYYFYRIFIPELFIQGFMAFFMMGYLCYDYIHYGTHHFSMRSPLFKFLKKFHLQHHYKHRKAQYGVSSPLWDYIFRTLTGPKEFETFEASDNSSEETMLTNSKDLC